MPANLKDTLRSRFKPVYSTLRFMLRAGRPIQCLTAIADVRHEQRTCISTSYLFQGFIKSRISGPFVVFTVIVDRIVYQSLFLTRTDCISALGLIVL